MCEWSLRSQKDQLDSIAFWISTSFDADGAGEVIAEERTEGLNALSGYATPQSEFQSGKNTLYINGYA